MDVVILDEASHPELNPLPSITSLPTEVAGDHFCVMDSLNKESDNSVVGEPGGNNTPADGTGKS